MEIIRADTAGQSAFAASHSPPRTFASSRNTRFATGGFTLLRYEKEEPTTVAALVRKACNEARIGDCD